MIFKFIRTISALAVLVTLAVAGMASTAQAYDHGRDRGGRDWHGRDGGYHHYYTGGYYRAPPPVVYGYPGYAAPPPVVYDEEPAFGINLHIH